MPAKLVQHFVCRTKSEIFYIYCKQNNKSLKELGEYKGKINFGDSPALTRHFYLLTGSFFETSLMLFWWVHKFHYMAKLQKSAFRAFKLQKVLWNIIGDKKVKFALNDHYLSHFMSSHAFLFFWPEEWTC